MSNEDQKFKTWEEVIVDFFERKRESEEEQYLKNKIKDLRKYYADQYYYDDQKLENFFDPIKNKKDESQSAIDFQRRKFKQILELQNRPRELNPSKFSDDYDDYFEKINLKFESNKWINDAASNASNIHFATHVIKLTHSKIDSSSLYDRIESQKMTALTTTSLADKKIDGAVKGNQFAPVFQFLELELNGNKLVSMFGDNNYKVLEPFAKNNEELCRWHNSFSKASSSDKPSTHSLAKQVYFPVDHSAIKSESYQLLCNIKSSSLAHAIYEKLKLFDNTLSELRQLCEKGKYSKKPSVSFSGRARLSITASNHSNASQLNGKRGGKLYLFSTQPPIWKSSLKPPVHKKSFFDGNFLYWDTKADIDYLRDFLLRFEHIDLSIKNPERYKWVEKWVNNIIDALLFYVCSIQNIPSGWSGAEDIRLKPAHKFFLDPYREDEAFQTERKASDWQAVVCEDFARWLNRQLSGKDKKFTPQAEHRHMWIDIMKQPLREFNETIEADTTIQTKATA